MKFSTLSSLLSIWGLFHFLIFLLSCLSKRNLALHIFNNFLLYVKHFVRRTVKTPDTLFFLFAKHQAGNLSSEIELNHGLDTILVTFGKTWSTSSLFLFLGFDSAEFSIRAWQIFVSLTLKDCRRFSSAPLELFLLGF